MSGRELYAALCAYVQAHGCEREEAHSAWWISADGYELTFGEAIEASLHKDGVDMREEPNA